MYRVPLVLACLACASHVVQSHQDWESIPQRRLQSNSLKPLATFLLASTPSLISTRLNQGLRAMSPASPLVRTGRQTMLDPSERSTAMGMASNCLAEGCPVDLVTDLYDHLKAVKNPTAEVKNLIKQLEKELGLEKPNKNELERIVGDASRFFTLLDEKPADVPLGYTGEKPGKKAWAPAKAWIPPATIDLASDCLKDGCPVDMVKELLTKLRAEENPSAEVLKTINDLQKVLGSIPPNKNELERVVEAALRAFSTINENAADVPLGYTGEKPGKKTYGPLSYKQAKATIDLASNCLQEGCPVDLVQELVAKLKAEENATPDTKKTIEQLEEILAMDEPNKNALEQLVTSVVEGLKTTYVTPMELMEGIGLVDKK